MRERRELRIALRRAHAVNHESREVAGIGLNRVVLSLARREREGERRLSARVGSTTSKRVQLFGRIRFEYSIDVPGSTGPGVTMK